jgi:hypothetical protein
MRPNEYLHEPAELHDLRAAVALLGWHAEPGRVQPESGRVSGGSEFTLPADHDTEGFRVLQDAVRKEIGRLAARIREQIGSGRAPTEDVVRCARCGGNGPRTKASALADRRVAKQAKDEARHNEARALEERRTAR